MINTIHYLLQALVCIAEIVGLIAGILAITRRKARLGGLAAAGFVLLGLSLLTNLGIELFRSYALSHFIVAFLWIEPCVASPLALLGVICLVVAIFSAVPAGKAKSEEPPSA